jgi:tripartite-type tricarboxylate transporter receptor subunit TctC
MARKYLIWFYSAIVAVVALTTVACSSAAPAPIPTTAPAASTKAPAAAATEPTKAPAAAPASKVNFPEKGKSITLIMPWAAGGSIDVPARIHAAALEKELGVPVQVVNREGAASQVGLTEAARAKPDGYTLAAVASGQFAYVYMDPTRNATYKGSSFKAIAGFSEVPTVWGVKADSQYKNAMDLINAAKANPRKIKLGTSGVGSLAHLKLLQLQKDLGFEFAIVFFEGDAQTTTAILGGNLDIGSGLIPGYNAQIQAGSMRLAGIAAKQRSMFMPDLPTFMEQGANFEVINSRSWAVPAGTPKEVTDVLTAAFKKVLTDPDVLAKTKAIGEETVFKTPEQVEAVWTQTEKDYPQQMTLLKEWQANH